MCPAMGVWAWLFILWSQSPHMSYRCKGGFLNSFLPRQGLNPQLSFPSVENSIPGRAQGYLYHFDFWLPDLWPLCGPLELWSYGSCPTLNPAWVWRETKRSQHQPAVRLGLCKWVMSQPHCHCWEQGSSSLVGAPWGGPLAIAHTMRLTGGSSMVDVILQLKAIGDTPLLSSSSVSQEAPVLQGTPWKPRPHHLSLEKAAWCISLPHAESQGSRMSPRRKTCSRPRLVPGNSQPHFPHLLCLL